MIIDGRFLLIPAIWILLWVFILLLAIRDRRDAGIDVRVASTMGSRRFTVHAKRMVDLTTAMIVMSLSSISVGAFSILIPSNRELFRTPLFRLSAGLVFILAAIVILAYKLAAARKRYDLVRGPGDSFVHWLILSILGRDTRWKEYKAMIMVLPEEKQEEVMSNDS